VRSFAAGKHSIWVESKDPYDRESARPATWKSEVLAVTLRPKERLEFEVCGTGEQGYSTWKIQPPKFEDTMRSHAVGFLIRPFRLVTGGVVASDRLSPKDLTKQ
jgi:hypothetical protein